MLPDLGPDEGVDLVVPRGEVEERRVDGEVGVQGVNECPENGRTLKPVGSPIKCVLQEDMFSGRKYCLFWDRL